jgi:transcriptional regulator with XRE-family HTH domain
MAIGVSVQFYGRIERGKGLPSMDTFAKLTLFGLSPSAVLAGTARGRGGRGSARLASDRPALAACTSQCASSGRGLLDELDRRWSRRD